MNHPPAVRPRRVSSNLPTVGVALVVAAVAVLAGGAVHLHEWVTSYRHIPTFIPGSAVVRIGFPLNAAASLLGAAAIAVCAFRKSKFTPWVIVGAVLFQVTSLASLILSRTSGVFGWRETGWTAGANTTRLVEIAALTALAVAGAALAASNERLSPNRLRTAQLRTTV